MGPSAPNTPSTQPRYDRRTLLALAGGIAVAALEARAARALSLPHALLPGTADSWELPAHDLAATRDGGQIAGTRVEWRADLRGGVAGAPASIDLRASLAYVASGSPYRAVRGPNPGTCSLLALRLDDGAVVWSDQIYPADRHGFDFNSAPVILDRILVAANKDGFHAWDRLARRHLWHRRLTASLPKNGGVAGPTNGPEGGPVATDGSHVYVLSNDASPNDCVAAALVPSTGRIVWRRRLPSFSFVAPALAGDRLFATGADGTLRALETATGRVVAAIPLSAPSTGAPVVGDGRLVVGAGAEPFLPGHLLVCVGSARVAGSR